MLRYIENYTKESDQKTKTNAEILAETFYDYHGRYDDGDSPADLLELKGVVIA